MKNKRFMQSPERIPSQSRNPVFSHTGLSGALCTHYCECNTRNARAEGKHGYHAYYPQRRSHAAVCIAQCIYRIPNCVVGRLVCALKLGYRSIKFCNKLSGRQFPH